MPRKKTTETKKTSVKKKKKKEEQISSVEERSQEHKTSEKKEISSAESKEIEEGQPQLNIGLIGHVDHGKTTLTQKLSGKWTDTHSEEIKRGITIRLGYADSLFYKCSKCDSPDCYTSKKICAHCNSETKPIIKVSFVDAPGHESLMATMLSGANIMDGALLLVAADETCPQPQTKEHLMALQIINVKNVVVVQNKIDLVSPEQAKKNYEQIKALLKGTMYENSPIVPISAKYNVNIDALIKTIYETITIPTRDISTTPLMFVARSFDINKPGTKTDIIVGGVLGGALKQGVLKVGDEIEILPGYEVEERNVKIWKSLKTKIVGLTTGGKSVSEVGPGGSIGLMTLLDPSIVKSDSLSGTLVSHSGQLPKMWYDLMLETHLLERVVGSKDDLDVSPIKLAEPLMLNVNSSATVGIVYELGKNRFKCKLKRPVCADAGSRVTISRRVGTRFRLIGYGIIK